MKRNVLLFAAAGMLFVCAAILHLKPFEPDKTREPKASTSFHQHIIIRNSADEPLLPSVKQAGAMETNREPQPLPNVDLGDPVVITKMPHVDAMKVP
ncbi:MULTISPECIES: hypothetical protein [Geobacillus]|uniref:Uncharacterized protein n=1 Tax=Geobacillus proteiniphilus TaxID=860353 RepID=A0A1Q5T6G1_9BACL|nr:MULTISPECIES: hypothetical protein [Geobacillus]KDE50272.1 hypothetical protein DI44_01015 [Geobacillus sp. CAMR5420]OKO95788.1 hypothetical protein BRO54_0778 [Geobacillus proteiniphilus]